MSNTGRSAAAAHQWCCVLQHHVHTHHVSAGPYLCQWGCWARQRERSPCKTSHTAAGSRGVPPSRCRTPPRQLPVAQKHQSAGTRFSMLSCLNSGRISRTVKYPRVLVDSEACARCGVTGSNSSFTTQPQSLSPQPALTANGTLVVVLELRVAAAQQHARVGPQPLEVCRVG